MGKLLVGSVWGKDENKTWMGIWDEVEVWPEYNMICMKEEDKDTENITRNSLLQDVF